MPMVFVARVDVGNVDLDHRPLERLDRIEDGDRGEGIAGRIDDDGVRGLSCRLDPVDELALVVRLVKGELEPEVRGELLAVLLDLRQRRRSVDLRLPHPQQVQVGTVQDHQSFHGVFLSSR
jgi:hypothetical protein